MFRRRNCWGAYGCWVAGTLVADAERPAFASLASRPDDGPAAAVFIWLDFVGCAYVATSLPLLFGSPDPEPCLGMALMFLHPAAAAEVGQER